MTERTVTHDVWVHSHAVEKPYGYQLHKQYGEYYKATLTIELPEREKMLKESAVRKAFRTAVSAEKGVEMLFGEESPAPTKQEPTVTRKYLKEVLWDYSYTARQEILTRVFGDKL